MSETETRPQKAPPIRPARPNELVQAHRWLQEAIETSPYYNDMFKAHEKQQLGLPYLQRLFDVDPAHVMMIVKDDVPKGIMINSPQYGTLWLQWSYMPPENRHAGHALAATRAFSDYWDNGRFHKIATYTKADNATANALLNRFGYVHVATLEKQMFGEDYMLFEHPLTKVTEGYDHGIPSEGRLGRFKRRMKRLLGL